MSINPHHNLPPGCGSWDTGTSDVYICETCGGLFTDAELDDDPPMGETRCKGCAAIAAEAEAAEAEREQQQLCNLPDSEFQMGGRIDTLARAAGYASGRAFVNDLGLWSATVEEAEAMLRADAAEPEADQSL